MINNIFPDMKNRLKGEYDYLVKKYSNIAFNVRYWDGTSNVGKKYLYATEGFITIPDNYSPRYINQFHGFLTHNSKFKIQNPQFNIILTNGPLKTDDYYYLGDNEFLDYDKKIKGICSMLKIYHTGMDGDILNLREEFVKKISVEPELLVHTYGPVPWGKKHQYKGFLDYKHSHYMHLKKMNEYLFCWCPEPMYHEMWSWDWITERLFNCFKSKVIPIYYGCYNVEKHIPTDLFVDYREFKNYKEISKYLIELSKNKKKCMEMIENAYEWNMYTRFSNIEDLENIFKSLE